MEEKSGEKQKESVMEQAAETKERLLQMAEISIWLDHYDDIFSDFDPRPYAHRALSDDFLNEARKANQSKPTGTIELKFLVPGDKRNRYNENIIKKRVRYYFNKHYHLIKKEWEGMIRQGAFFAVIGIILMFLATYILFKSQEKTMLVQFLIIMLEPAGWFFFWEGLRIVVFESRKEKPELDFHERMSRCAIEFLSY